MDDKALAKLQSLPEIGPQRARALFEAGFMSIADVAAAQPDRLAAVRGVGKSLAAKIQERARSELAAAKASDEERTRVKLFICPECGALVSDGSDKCPKCSVAFGKEEELVEMPLAEAKGEVDGHWYREEASLFICPECGSLVADGSGKCPKCGVLFEADEEPAPAPAQVTKTAPSAETDIDGHWYRDKANLFICPECGSLVADGSGKCPKCGVLFEAGEEPVEMPLVEKKEEVDGHWYREEARLFICPECGSLVAGGSSACPKCGVTFEEGDEPVEMPIAQAETGKEPGAAQAAPNLIICPECGSLVADGSEKCPKCSFKIDFQRAAPEQGPVESGEDVDGLWIRKQADLFLCPECGALVSEGSSSCPKCGEALEEGDAEEKSQLPRAATRPEDAAAKPATDIMQPPERGDFRILCPLCGDPLPDGTGSCPGCGFAIHVRKGPPIEKEIAPETAMPPSAIPEVVPPPAVEPKPTEDAELMSDMDDIISGICGKCGSRLDATTGRCASCAEERKERAEEQSLLRQAKRRRGVSKDFHDRWADMKAPEHLSVSKAFAERWGRSVKKPEKEDAKAAPEPAPEPSRSGPREGDLERELEGLIIKPGKPEKARAAPQKVMKEDDQLDELLVMTGDAEIEALPKEEKRRMERQIDAYDLILDADPTRDEIWQAKGDILRRLGRMGEAVKCFDEAIRRSYDAIQRMSQSEKPPTPAKGRAESMANGAMGRTNGLTNGTKGRASGLTNGARERRPLGATPGGAVSAKGRVNGLVNGRGASSGLLNGTGRGRTNGRVNGLVNGMRGRINGLVNGRGRTNGKVNGLVNGKGRISGLVNGRGRTNGKVDGMVNGRGRVNGLVNGRGSADGLVNGLGFNNGQGIANGFVNGRGRVNGLINGFGGAGMGAGSAPSPGLVNGMGFVNGTGIGEAPRFRGRAAARSNIHLQGLVMLAFVFALLLVLPTLFQFTTQGQAEGLNVDGYFSDWNGRMSYAGALPQGATNPDIAARDVRAAIEDSKLFVFVDVDGRQLEGVSSTSGNTTSALYVLIDADGDPGTGYSAGGVGADYLVQVEGWRGVKSVSQALTFRAGANQRDWSAFGSPVGVSAAVGGSQLELAVPLNGSAVTPGRGPVLVLGLTDGNGNLDVFDVPVRPGLPTLMIEQAALPQDSAMPGDVATAASFFVRSYGEQFPLSALNVTLDGSGTYGADYSFTGVTVNGMPFQHTFSFAGSNCQIRFQEPLEVSFAGVYVNVTASLPSSAAAGATFGARAISAQTVEPAHISLGGGDGGLTLIGQSVGPAVDGSFADWAQSVSDPAGDVRPPSDDATSANSNVDLVAAGWRYSLDHYFFAEVAGNLFGGSLFPRYLPRGEGGQQPQAVDTDRDSVPDATDPMPLDFNDDGANDSASTIVANGRPAPDVDSDGVPDYPYRMPDGTTDRWLNTTLPLDFPPQYAGRFVSVYIGPVAPAEPVERLDTDAITVYIDADGSALTGARPYPQVGAEYAATLSGSGGAVLSSGFYRYAPEANASDPWVYVGAIDNASTRSRMEIRVSGLYLAPPDSNMSVFIDARDWNGDHDITDSPMAQPLAAGTRAPAGDNVVINEIVSQPNTGEWIEICNPTNAPINIGGWRIRQGGTTLMTFPANTILGAFGSGTEYYIVDLSGNANDLPNGGATVRLQWDSPGPGWTTIDQTAYPGGMTGAQSWSRFKNETWGMPTDTDSDANDFYVSTSPTRGAPNDRRAPNISVDKAGDMLEVAPSGSVTYTIWYNNSGDGNARHVWVNDTLPAGTAYTSSSVPYSSFAGSTYTWYFANVAPGSYSFTLTVTVDSSLPIGSILTNNVSLGYTDQLARWMGWSNDSCNVTVVAPAPNINVSKVADVAIVSPGDVVTYTIYFNNTGTGAAGHVWLNDTLPVGMNYLSASPAPDSTAGQTQYWHFTNVSTGGQSLTITANVSSAVAPGSTLTNNVSCNYTNLVNVSFPRTNSSATVTVVPALSRIVINEISSRPNPEWIELCNPTGSSVSIAGWRLRLGGNTIYTFPAGTVLGAWGSGSEYIMANLTVNSLPNGGGTVRLQYNPGAGWVTIDMTVYPGIAAGQTWSRFKDEDTGMPDDTNNDAVDFYVSNNGWIVPEGPTPNAPNDRKRPVMSVVKGAAIAEAEPGDYVNYTIWYNNTGDGNGKDIWVNDTLPSFLNYVSATPSPDVVSGQNLTWFFGSVVHDSTNSIIVYTVVSDVMPDNTALPNSARLNYSDQLRRPMGNSTSWYNITGRRPQIIVSKAANATNVVAGGSLTYTIWYNNTGSRNASNVWINDTLPSYVTYVSASPAPGSIAGLVLRWSFTNVTPGAHSITINVTINATAPSGNITNWAFLNYTTSKGRALPGSSDSVTVVIPEFNVWLLLALLVPALLLARRKLASIKMK
ncbi:MAG: DUF11 domain-containing protein [Euryarchaeota archaeon]|nr:DUF11 domain-containing protein [Euryarchaeota archaeon]